MILIMPFTMRESINYAIRARLRGEQIVGAASEHTPYPEYCDEYTILPSIFEPDFAGKLQGIINQFGITRFYTPHHLVYDHVKSLNLTVCAQSHGVFSWIPLEFAEGHPVTILEEEYKAATKSGLPPEMAVQTSRIYGHMSEEKLSGMIECFKRAPTGHALEIGTAWGKSLKALCMLADGNVYAIDTWDKEKAEQKDKHPLVTTSCIDWKLMEHICKANVPEAIYDDFPPRVSVLHIDGNHDYECVKRDWDIYRKRLISTGWLILDDIDWPGVAKLWSEISGEFTDCYEMGGAMFARKA